MPVRGNGIDIVLLEPWMVRGVAELDGVIYGTSIDKALPYYDQRFLSDYSRSEAIPLVGLSDGRVMAFQSYSPWPYERGTQRFRSLQSGLTMVHPEFRRRGLFSRMLREGNTIANERGADFFMGFPVDMSLGGFIKDGWSVLGRTRWWVRVLRPASLIIQKRHHRIPSEPLGLGEQFDAVDHEGIPLEGPQQFRLTADRSFLEWRYPGRTKESFRQFHYEERGHRVTMTLRLRTDRGVREAIIGSVTSDVVRSDIRSAALRALARHARVDRHLAMISMLVFPSRRVHRILLRSGFAPAVTAAPLIVKKIAGPGYVLDPDKWQVGAEDIDHWVTVDDLRIDTGSPI